MQAEWIRRPEAEMSVVFVHGILSSGEACWLHENGSYWPELLKSEPELRSLGIYVFTYQTGIFSGSYRLGDIVDALKEHMRLDGVLGNDRLIFVCHSMGGIVVRKFILERMIELIEAEKEIGLFLVSSPSLGSSYADWLSPLARLFEHTQADVLRFVRDNDWLKDLDKEFKNLKEDGKLRIKGKELVEDKFVFWKKRWRRQVVEPFSGAIYFGEPFKVPKSNHFSIAKPENSRAVQHRLLCRFILDMLQSQPAMPAAPNDKAESYPPQASVRKVVRTWVDRLFIAQRAEGGILANHKDPSYPQQAWATAQCLKGILASREGVAEYADQIKAAFEFLERVRLTGQNEGWGYWENTQWTVTEIAAWVCLASIESMTLDLIWNASELDGILKRIHRELEHMASRQDGSGGWSPIKEVSSSFTRTYSTVMALWSFIEAKKIPTVSRSIGSQYDELVRRGIGWLLNTYNERLGWLPNPNRPHQNSAFPGLTAQILYVLARLEEKENFRPLQAHPVYKQAKKDFLKNQELTQRHISLNDHIITADQHFPPTDFLLEGSTFLWFPWALALYTYLATDMALSQSERATAVNFQSNLLSKLHEVQEYIEVEETYMLAESLFAFSYILPHLR